MHTESLETKRSKFRRGLLAVLSVGALTLGSGLSGTSAQAEEGSSPERASSSLALSSTDVEVVDGVLFGIGPFAEAIENDISTMFSSPTELAAIEAKIVTSRDAFVIAKGREVDAAVDKIRSGSVNAVAAGLKDLGLAFNAYIDDTYTTEELEAAVEDAGGVEVVPMCGVVAVCAAAVAVVAYAAVVVHNALAVTAAAGVVVSLFLWCGAWVGCGKAAAADEGGDRVKHEKFVAHVTRLGAELPE